MEPFARTILLVLVAAAGVALGGCGESDPQTDALLGVKSYIDDELVLLADAAVELKSAAPEPDADGWNATDDAAAVTAMRGAWGRARASYEHIEGAIAILFPMIDVSTDARYDSFIEAAPDDDLFDGVGVTGVHAIERILWSDSHPAAVVAFESALAGYEPARFPENEDEARAFRDELCQRLVDDFERMQHDFAPLALDTQSAFRGVIGSLREQHEKVLLAATGEDESRYAQHTLEDMRANLEGGRRIYEAFAPWLDDEPGGPALDTRIHDGFERVADHYASIAGDAVPAVPADWNPDEPSSADLATPYGMLFALLARESDPATPGSLVEAMGEGADALGIPRLP